MMSHELPMPAESGSGASAAPPPPDYPWAALTDDDLLKVRIRDLDLRLESSHAAVYRDRLYAELEERGVAFKPGCYLTTEWLAPDKVPLIGIPFCLAHPRLKQLEQTMMLEVEGGTDASAMKLMRHEAGHAFNYAYQLYRRSRWRELFGRFTMEYDVHRYYPRPFSRQFVVHLGENYAQAHPDEDFAETFAVWLTPGFDWRQRYRGWGALRKLEYVDHLMKEVGATPPPVPGGPRLWPASRMRSTLAHYYKKKRMEFAEGYPGFYDPDLNTLFSGEGGEGRISAVEFFRKHRKMLTTTVARWTHVSKYAVDQRIRRLSRRAKELRLYLRTGETEAILPVSVYLTSVVCDDRERAYGNRRQTR